MNKEKIIAIVGAGPNCTYALDLLLRKFAGRSLSFSLTILIFESTKEFGAGKTHSTKTPKNILLNRVAGQISLGASKLYKPESMERFSDYSETFLIWAETDEG